MHRRDALHLLAASGALPLAGGVACSTAPGPGAGREGRAPASRMPVLFQAHGAPMLLDDAGWVAELAAWARALPRPRAILVVSAHWDARPAAIGATVPVPLVYDFYGFPEKYYRLTYPSPGAPALAERVRGLLAGAGLGSSEAPDRGLDHGAYVTLMCMYPEADVPVLQVSMPGLDPATLVRFGRALAPVRDEGVLVIGSGFLTHNLRLGMMRETPAWATEFDAWVADALDRRDVDALVDFRARAPGARIAHPTYEHYAPILVAAGAAETSEPLAYPIRGFWMGSFTKRSVQFG